MGIARFTTSFVDRALGRQARLSLDRAVLGSSRPTGHYHGLSRSSLWLSGLAQAMDAPQVNVVLPAVSPGAIFAGVRTALEVAVLASAVAGRPLRIITFQPRLTGAEEQAVRRMLAEEWPDEFSSVSFVDLRRLPSLSISPRDLWIATHWTTAHAIDIAGRLGLIDPQRVLYLIQDYEPAFMASSTDSALARSTYHAGYTPLVNSSPLRDFLVREENVEVPDRQTFAPSLDLERLEKSAAERRPGSGIRIMFYGRPSKPRNMFALGAATLKRAAAALDDLGVDYVVVSAGEQHPDIRLSSRSSLTSLGSVPWADYFHRLSLTDVVLSLQATPHPSHPPLDAVVSGAYAVTNEIAGTRGGLSTALLADRPDPDVLAGRLVEAVTRVRDSGCRGYDQTVVGLLGNDLRSATVQALAAVV